MKYRVLGKTGLSVSVLGFGAAPLGDEYGKLDAAEAERAVHLAIDEGVNFFDTAPYYGRTLSETRLGGALRGRRDKVILATKCARYDFRGFDFSAGRVLRSIDESLQRLQTDYLDLFQVHDIEFGDKRQILEETIPAMHRIKATGKARFIGVTGLPVRMLRDVCAAADIDTVLSYCRYNLLNRDMDEVLTPLAREKNLGLINASPLHMGMITDEGPPEWHPAPESVKSTARAVVKLCREHGTDPAAIGMQFVFQYPHAASTLSGLKTCDQVRRNLATLYHAPDPELLNKIDQLVAPIRGVIWPSGSPENSDV